MTSETTPLKLTLKDKIYGGFALLGLTAVVGYGIWDANRNAPETYADSARAFPKGFHPQQITLKHPTKGDITDVWTIPGEHYKITRLSDGRLEISGDLGYKIRDAWKWGPKDPDHSDAQGHTPDNNDFDQDVRYGTITGTQDSVPQTTRR